MSQQPEAAPELAALLDRHRDEMASAFQEVLQTRGGPHYRAQPADDLRAVCASAIGGVIDALRAGAYTSPDRVGASIVPRHVAQGFDIGEEIEALLLLRETLLSLLWRSFPADSIEGHKSAALLDDYILGMSVRFSHDYAEGMRADLQEQQQRTELMLRVVQAASSSPDLDLALERVAEGMVTALGARFCGLYLLDPERGLLVPRAAAGDLMGPRLELFRLYCLDPASDPRFGDVLASEEPMCIIDVQADPRTSRETAKALGIKSTLAVPIKAGTRVLGLAVIATFDELHQFDPREIGLAQGMASACALAIENGRLFEETRKSLAESESLQKVTAALLRKTALEEVLDIVCSEARRLTGAADSAVLLLEEGDSLRIVRSTLPLLEDPITIPLSGPWTGKAVRTGEPLVVNDLTGENAVPDWKRLSSLLSAPLKVAGSTIGALDVVNKPGGFTLEDQRIISLFADQAAIAIENARLRQRGEQLAVVEERQRLSRDLHDSVTQSIFGVTLYGEAVSDQLAAGQVDRASEFLSKLRTSAQESLREMRLLVFELRPPILDKEGLVAALQARLDSVETRGGLKVKLDAEGCPRLPLPVEQELYRIAQEALNNVLKHSQARRVEVDIRLEDGNVRLEIRDDGSGFDLEAARLQGGMGLLGMDERAKRLGGTLRVESAAGRGSRVTIEAPVDTTELPVDATSDREA